MKIRAKRIFLFMVFILLSSQSPIAQNFTQVVRGRVVDALTHLPVVNATVEIIDSNEITAKSTSDSNGNFAIENVGIGRISIMISKEGYNHYLANNVNHISGKQTVLEVELSESVIEMKGVTKKAKSRNVNNRNISLSARSFDIEDTRRYAGSRNDPARMASNFAGVMGNDDQRNDIIIRGNSPQGLLWRMEGLDIPNPNHFGAMGATGGPVGILNNNVLAKSDFMTSAFPASYGNAIAGVFDLQMRNGNKDKTEYTGQIGFNGFEIGVEGPFSKKNKASYIINYRYSTLVIMQKMGLEFGTGTVIPYYQDLSFKVDIPFKKDRFSIFGIGGFSKIHFSDEEILDTGGLIKIRTKDLDYRTRMGVTGASYTHYFTPKLFLKTSIGTTYTSVKTLEETISKNYRQIEYGDNSSLIRHILNSTLTYKRNSQQNLSFGINIQNIRFRFNDSSYYDSAFHVLRNEKGNTILFQSFLTYQYKLTKSTTLNTGLHFQALSLNNSMALEPRIGIIHQLTSNKRISAASGMHSQMQNMQVYFLKTFIPGGVFMTNRNLGFTKSIHHVIAYDYAFHKTWNFKTEVYYQYLYNVPVNIYPSNFTTLNEGATYDNPHMDSLKNGGTGENYGIEFTLEKYFTKGFYLLNTISLYQSKCTGSNGIKRNTAYNSNYIFNLLTGKEIKLSNTAIIAFDTKIILAGGRRYTPIDLERSRIEKAEVRIEDQAFEKQSDPYFRLDFKVSYRKSANKITQEWFVDIQNITNRRNIFSQSYDAVTNNYVNQYQLGLFPNFNYRINF